MPRPHEAQWGRTVTIPGRLKGDPRYEEPYDGAPEHGFFEKYPIIGHDMPINGGVYLGGSRREAILVDDRRYPKELDKVYAQARDKVYAAVARNEEGLVDRILRPVYDTTMDVLPYRADTVNALTAPYHGDQLVPINKFIKARAGICRHQGVLNAYLLERLQREGELEAADKISVDRNGVPGVGAHGWARYTSSDGTVYILDSAQQYVGRLDEAGENRWPYSRPEDIRSDVGRHALEAVTIPVED